MFGNGRDQQAATGSHSAPFSLIGADVVVTGNMSASLDLHVDGRIDGDLDCANVVQGSESVIRGNVVAKIARIAGIIEGSVTADELVIERDARITGDCHYGTLSVAAGAAVEGRFQPKGAPALELRVVASGE